MVARGLSVRDTEAIIRREATPPVPPVPAPTSDPNTRAAEEQLRLALGTRVRIVQRGGKGRIEVDFNTELELQRLFELLVSHR